MSWDSPGMPSSHEENMNKKVNSMKGHKSMKIKLTLGVLGAVTAFCLWGGGLPAQDDNGGTPALRSFRQPTVGGPLDSGGGGPGGDFDPAEFQRRMMADIRQNLNVTNDDEWVVIQPMVQKVMEARREAGRGGGPGGPGGGPGGPGGGPGGPGGRGGFGPQASAEQQALQKVIDDKAPLPQIKDALAKYRAARAEKQTRLEAAQADLQKVLTTKQEAQAVLMGLLR
jgi:hypothetical protein